MQKDRDSAWWIVQVIGSSTIAYGPYFTDSAAQKAYNSKVSGGEVHLDKYWYTGKDDHDKVVDEFKANKMVIS